jgi:hypothetical protein
MDSLMSKVISVWQAIVSTLLQRGLLRERTRQGGVVLPKGIALLLPDRVVFLLDMQHLGGVSREAWLDRNLWAQCRAALEGRQIFVSDGGGLAITVALESGSRRQRVPALIPLTAEHLPDEPYQVTLGYDPRGPILLDLAGDQRAILVGGTTGSGKTNLLQSIVLQLAAKHSPHEVAFAIVDTKEVDFNQEYAGLSHLFTPFDNGRNIRPEAGSIAHDLEDAARLIERVENERLRRQALMAQAGVADWRDYDYGAADPFPLLLLVVDEAADFARTQAMKTLVQVARKGRAFGISIVVGTQYPTTDVIDAQVKANLPVAIGFQTRTTGESRVILGRAGAEKLDRPGLALAFLDGRWRTVQTLRAEPGLVRPFVAGHVAVERPALGEVEAELVVYAIEELDGAFIINTLYEAFKGQISKYRLTQLAQQWESRGWLTPEQRNEQGYTQGRMVTDELAWLAMDQPRGRATGSMMAWAPAPAA